MALNRIRLGDYIERYSQKCNISNLTVDDVSGVNKDKEFFEPSKQVGKDTSDYKVVPPNYFACNLMHVGRDRVLPIAINRTNKDKYVSPAYTVFRVINEEVILKDFLFIFVNSEEKDRYFWFHCDSSVRDGMEWSSFCDIELDIPSIEIQRKYVEIYDGLIDNIACFEKNQEDFSLICTAFIEQLRRSSECHKIGDYIQAYNEKNIDGKITLEQGINIEKQFISPQRSNSNLTGRKIVRHGQIAYCTQLNNANVAIAYREGEDCVVSSVYDVFEIVKKDELLPKYLLLWLIRPEFGRFVYWASEGSAYEFLNYQNLANYQIPVPSIDVQESIISMYELLNERKTFVRQLKEKLKTICPILVKGAIEEAKEG